MSALAHLADGPLPEGGVVAMRHVVAVYVPLEFEAQTASGHRVTSVRVVMTRDEWRALVARIEETK